METSTPKTSPTVMNDTQLDLVAKMENLQHEITALFESIPKVGQDQSEAGYGVQDVHELHNFYRHLPLKDRVKQIEEDDIVLSLQGEIEDLYAKWDANSLTMTVDEKVDLQSELTGSYIHLTLMHAYKHGIPYIFEDTTFEQIVSNLHKIDSLKREFIT